MSSSAAPYAHPIRVAMVEDQGGLRESLEKTLTGVPGIICVASCANAEQAIDELPLLQPQVVLMDINLPGMSGVECVRHLVDRIPGVLVVMLTVFDNTEAIFNSLKSGACGYLHKPVRGRELVAAIREVAAGGSPMSARIARMVVQTFSHPTVAPIPAQAAEVSLTDREQAVLDLVLEGFPYKQIADRLELSVYTVNFHIRNIYGKLQVHSRSEAVAKLRKG
ncbi:MAG: DNA-binding response regulator [Verrucomicrobia bacterium]|nr:MAG: DNA-binding response regulator [Verrucomicrobiota bacterium]TAE89100.1 MAG: DNA-binding response regulator [Verrucomicrobiota bacterium]TAF28027.1 MAG: DNA-binding response regulator [Verrucomicrobiota bacterium]TAF42874.1 MAG: DNA-binding response regulator [Verrucomicrobiota bacterium]